MIGSGFCAPLPAPYRQASMEDTVAFTSELIDFLEANSIIHTTHPENFFTDLADVEHRSPAQQRAMDLVDGVAAVIGDSLDEVACLVSQDPRVPGSQAEQLMKRMDPIAGEFWCRTAALQLQREPAASLQPSFADLNATTANDPAADTAFQALVSHGMSAKKRHEVPRMRHFVRETKALVASSGRPAVDTVVNVGEGKGYVSRVLSISDGLQVIGIDCNPNHREGSFERVEKMLASSVGAAPSGGGDGEDPALTNLLYRDRGFTSSVTGRVTTETSTLADMMAKDPDVLVAGDESATAATASDGGNNADAAVVIGRKVKCRLCGHLLRYDVVALAKHILRSHGSEVSEEERAALDTSVESSARRAVLARFFIMCETDDDQFQSVSYPRGSLLTAKRLDEAGDGAAVALTLLGFDDSSGSFKVRLHSTGGKKMVRLVDGTSPPVDIGAAANAFGVKRPVYGVMGAKVMGSVVKRPIHRDLRNCMMIGLHTCGDLGSNICRLFADPSSRCPALVLVSCCWHALTPAGFPMSRLLRSDKTVTMNMLSFMLATQPVEMWGSRTTDEQRNAQRLRFYRALLPFVLGTFKNGSPDQPHAVDLSPKFLRGIAKLKDSLTLAALTKEVWKEAMDGGEASLPAELETVASEIESRYNLQKYVAFVVLRMWLAPLIEGLLLLDRSLFLANVLRAQSASSRVALVPFFDGALSPRMFGIVALR